MCTMVTSRYVGDGHPTFNDGILIMGIYKPLRTWVEFPIPYYIEMSWELIDPIAHMSKWCRGFRWMCGSLFLVNSLLWFLLVQLCHISGDVVSSFLKEVDSYNYNNSNSNSLKSVVIEVSQFMPTFLCSKIHHAWTRFTARIILFRVFLLFFRWLLLDFPKPQHPWSFKSAIFMQWVSSPKSCAELKNVSMLSKSSMNWFSWRWQAWSANKTCRWTDVQTELCVIITLFLQTLP